MCQALGQFFDVSSVVGENSSGQGISGTGIQQVERFLYLIGFVYVDRQYRTEQFFAHRNIVRFLGLDNSRVNKVAFGFIVFASQDHFGIGRSLRIIDCFGQFVERSFIYHSIDEVTEIFDSSGFDFIQICLHQSFYFRPDVGRNVSA